MAQGERKSGGVVALDQIGEGLAPQFSFPFSPCGRRWREAPDEGSLSAETDPSSVSLPLRVSDPPSPTRGEGKRSAPRYLPNLSAAHAYRLPGTGFSPPRPFGEMCRPMISGSAISAGKIRRLEEQFRLGMDRVEGLLRQRVLQFTRAARERGQRGRAIDRDANVGEAARSASQLAQHEGEAMAQRQPVRRQILLLHQFLECPHDRIVRRQIQNRVAELAPTLPGEVGLCRIDLDRLQQQHVGVEPQPGASPPSAACGRNR